MNVLERYNKFVKPAFEEYIKPTRRYADIIIPQGSENKVAIDFVCINLKHQLDIRQNVMNNNKLKHQIEFNLHDLFDTKTINSNNVITISDDNKQELLKNILEDFLNHDRKLYLR